MASTLAAQIVQTRSNSFQSRKGVQSSEKSQAADAVYYGPVVQLVERPWVREIPRLFLDLQAQNEEAKKRISLLDDIV